MRILPIDVILGLDAVAMQRMAYGVLTRGSRSYPKAPWILGSKPSHRLLPPLLKLRRTIRRRLRLSPRMTRLGLCQFIFLLLQLFVIIPPAYAEEAEVREYRGNVAIIRQGGGGQNVVKIDQQGQHNKAKIEQDGNDNLADIYQQGEENQLNATQTGDHNQLKRQQTGHTITTINQNGRIVTYDENGHVVKVH